MAQSHKTILMYLLFCCCFSSNLMAAETEAQRVEREKRAAIERHKNDRTVHGKLESSLPAAKQKADALLEKWQQEDEWNRKVRQDQEERKARERNNRIFIQERQKQEEQTAKVRDAAKTFKWVTSSCVTGSQYSACLCQKTIGQIRDECRLKSADLYCAELDKSYSRLGSWDDIKQNCTNASVKRSEQKNLVKCIEGDTSACLLAPSIVDDIRRFDSSVSADTAILALQYACYRSSQHCQVAKDLEWKHGKTYSSDKRKLRIKKRIAAEKCNLKPEIDSCLEAGNLEKDYENVESQTALNLFKQACDLVDIKSRSTHPACAKTSSLDIEQCSGSSSMVSNSVRKQHCINIFEIMKDPKTIKEASYALIKNCVDRNFALREKVCTRAVERTNHPLAIVELCTIYRKSSSRKAGEICPLMEKLVDQSDVVEQMLCVAGVSDGENTAKDGKVCERALSKALKKNLSAKWFYTLSDSYRADMNIGAQNIIYSKVAYARARYASSNVERKFWRNIGCKKWSERDFCDENDSNTYKYLIDIYATEKERYLGKCFQKKYNEKEKGSYAIKSDCTKALVEAYERDYFANFIDSALPRNEAKKAKAKAMIVVAEKKTNSREKFVWFFRSCRHSPSNYVCKQAAVHAGKAKLPAKVLDKAPTQNHKSMMVIYKESLAETQAQQKQIGAKSDLQASFVDYPGLRNLNRAKGSTEKKAVYLYKNGDAYDGTWKGGHPDGTGIYTFANGDMYIGDFKSAQLEGKGMFRDFAKGSIHEGGYKSSGKHGHGILTTRNGDRQEGNWVNGALDGKSTITTRNNNIVELTYKNGKLLNKKMEGIGVAFKLNESSKQYFITGLGNNMPAKIAGIKVGDILVSANGISLSGLSNKEVIQHIKGPAGSIVKLEIMRKDKAISLSVKRGRIDVDELQRSAVKSSP